MTTRFLILLLVPLAALRAADLGGVVVKLDDYAGPASVSAQLVERFRMQIAVDPRGETKPLVIRVELPESGARAWPAADVEVDQSTEIRRMLQMLIELP